ncbi:hypothetical protein MHU86_21153 [Fragilaria crotonensis]|nr:hypothetical protein MHU86_21153 [Fragilaria crotonensis]
MVCLTGSLVDVAGTGNIITEKTASMIVGLAFLLPDHTGKRFVEPPVAPRRDGLVLPRGDHCHDLPSGGRNRGDSSYRGETRGRESCLMRNDGRTPDVDQQPAKCFRK